MNGTPVYRRGGRIYRHGSRIRRGNNRRYHEGGPVQSPTGETMIIPPHNHPHSLPGSMWQLEHPPGGGNFHPPGSGLRPRPRPRPIGPGGPSGPGMPPPHTPAPIYRHGGRVGSPNSCLDGRGNNVPC